MAISWAQQEMQGAAVWHRRCIGSLAAICERRFERPQVSFSKACGDAVRQAAHRICSNEKMTVDGLLRGHFQQTAARVGAAWKAHPEEPILVLQDTTELKYTSHQATEGLGPIHTSPQGRGLFAHPALALPAEGVPFGLVHLSIWARDPKEHGKTRDDYARAKEATALKESQKWLNGLWGVEATLPPEIPFLLIADRESDFFDYFAAPRRPNSHLLVRARHPRRVLLELPEGRPPRRSGEILPEVLAAVLSLGQLEIDVPRKPGQKARQAQLELRVVQVWLQPADLRKADEDVRNLSPQQVWVVEARETGAPTGVEPLLWVLLSTQPVETFPEAVRTVGFYRRRWVIEELSLVMKSGLGAEKLQMDDRHTLQNTLALLYVVAWRILQLRDINRFLPAAPAATLMDETELKVLAAVTGAPVKTAAEVVRAIAKLAGFPSYPSAGRPGVRTLWEGLRRLEGAVFGWKLARGETEL
jgi:hypothetical protein